MRGQSVREVVVADRMSCAETRSAVLPEKATDSSRQRSD